jgi:hypothetical protein
VFHTSLKFGDYDRVSLCIGLLFKLDEKQIVEKIMIERISADIAYAREYSAIKKSLSRYNLKEEIAFMENIVTNIFIENINKFDSNTFIKLLNKYNFVNRDNLLKLINKSNFDFAMDDLIAINTMLEKQAIDGWKINLNNSLTKYIKYLLENDDKNIFNNNSITLTGHMTFKAILKVSKSIELAEEIIGDEFKLNDCADIFYNWTFEIREDNAIKKYLELGGNKNE